MSEERYSLEEWVGKKRCALLNKYVNSKEVRNRWDNMSEREYDLYLDHYDAIVSVIHKMEAAVQNEWENDPGNKRNGILDEEERRISERIAYNHRITCYDDCIDYLEKNKVKDEDFKILIDINNSRLMGKSIHAYHYEFRLHIIENLILLLAYANRSMRKRALGLEYGSIALEADVITYINRGSGIGVERNILS